MMKFKLLLPISFFIFGLMGCNSFTPQSANNTSPAGGLAGTASGSASGISQVKDEGTLTGGVLGGTIKSLEK